VLSSEEKADKELIPKITKMVCLPENQNMATPKSCEGESVLETSILLIISKAVIWMKAECNQVL